MVCAPRTHRIVQKVIDPRTHTNVFWVEDAWYSFNSQDGTIYIHIHTQMYNCESSIIQFSTQESILSSEEQQFG